MIVYIALCDKNGIIDRVIRNIPIGSINEGQNIRDLFEDSEKIDSLLTQTHSYGVSSQLRLKSGKNSFVYITIMTLKDKCLVFIYDIESPDQLTLLTETALSVLNVPEITGNESYESGYYEIQKLNSQLINYQRTLAKTNARLQGLLEEARAAKCTIEELERDTLTGLYREKIFYDKAHKIISKYAESDFDIIAVDIEQFKIVNDTFGSDSGDRLLMDLAVCLLSIQSDNKVLITRARADTFFALIPREKNIYNNLQKNLNIFIEDYPLPMRLQIKTGIYEITDRTLSVARMCDRALLAADSIKGIFSRKYAFYDNSMQEKLMLEQKIVNTMVESLQRGDFLVYLQPKVDVNTEKIIGAEALIRWNHPEFGMISPGDFIPIFERNSFIYALDMFVWEKSCSILSDWKRKGLCRIPLSVNVSRVDLYHEDLPDTLFSFIQTYDLSPHDLHLEITESAYVKDSVQLLTIIKRLKQKGFIIEMDDFGSGYSSLNTLSELPIDVIKLDLKFIREAENKPRHQKVMQAAINLAKELNLQIIAEGVETKAQAELLKELDCTFAQGYLYGRPVPESEFLKDLKNV